MYGVEWREAWGHVVGAGRRMGYCGAAWGTRQGVGDMGWQMGGPGACREHEEVWGAVEHCEGVGHVGSWGRPWKAHGEAWGALGVPGDM